MYLFLSITLSRSPFRVGDVLLVRLAPGSRSGGGRVSVMRRRPVGTGREPVGTGRGRRNLYVFDANFIFSEGRASVEKVLPMKRFAF